MTAFFLDLAEQVPEYQPTMLARALGITPESAVLQPRAQAAVEHRTTYLSGEACPKGHLGARYTINSSCVQCQREWTAANRLRIKQLRGEAGRVHV